VPRIVASFLIVAYFFTAVPVWARRPGTKPAALDAVPSSPSNACGPDIVDRVRDIHAVILDMAKKAHDAGQSSMRLHRTSRWVGYKHIESKPRRRGHSKTTLRTIADLSFTLDSLPDEESKINAETLSATYENAVNQILDYAHVSLDYERMENFFTGHFRTRMFLTYSVNGAQPLRNYWDNITRHHLDERYTEVGDALRSLEIPEHLYARSCAPATIAATIDDPCEVSALSALHATVVHMGKTAQDAGRISRDLHTTNRCAHTNAWRTIG